MPDRPNILLVLTDQQHWQMMSNTGNTYLKTPAMDRLAAEGTRFDRTYCTNPVCSPSRFSLFTGRMPSAIGMRANGPPDRDQPLPEEIECFGAGRLLSEAGYHCVYGGKQHLPRTSAERLGFELLTKNEREELADQCVDFLQQPSDEPFFLVASFINPHDICYMAVRDFAESEQEKRLVDRGGTECATLDEALQLPAGVSEAEFFEKHCPPLPPNHAPQADEPEAIQDLIAQRPFRLAAKNQWSAQRWRMHRWAYARLTERVDRQIGRVLDALDASPHRENTVVIFTSDHGDMDSAHHMEHKTAFYEEAAHVPLIIRHPGHVPASRVDDQTLISNGLDLIPTLCDYAGAPTPTPLEGRSFRAAAEGTKVPSTRQVIRLENEIGRAIITGRYKYVLYDQGANREQLYDLLEDPGETRNALHDPEHFAACDELRRLFQEAFDFQNSTTGS